MLIYLAWNKLIRFSHLGFYKCQSCKLISAVRQPAKWRIAKHENLYFFPLYRVKGALPKIALFCCFKLPAHPNVSPPRYLCLSSKAARWKSKLYSCTLATYFVVNEQQIGRSIFGRKLPTTACSHGLLGTCGLDSFRQNVQMRALYT